ncbi:MAG TPA: LapA family protein, partial [Gammaproteobacteria bacterium]|nr:LapA family protein [Gammaproteobacteria bacterium]
MRRLIVLIIALAVFGLTLAMVLVNLSKVQVGYLFGTTHLPLAVVLIIALVLGMLIGALCLLPAVIRARSRARRMQGR